MHSACKYIVLITQKSSYCSATNLMSLISHIITLHITVHYTYRFILNASSDVLNVMRHARHKKKISRIIDNNKAGAFGWSADFTVRIEEVIDVCTADLLVIAQKQISFLLWLKSIMHNLNHSHTTLSDSHPLPFQLTAVHVCTSFPADTRG